MKKVSYRIRDDVYIIGAGFSAGLGYPLTTNLLDKTWQRMGAEEADKLFNIIKFHFPYFDPINKNSFPNIEKLLTLMSVNEELFHASRVREGNFRKQYIQEAREILLFEISKWFHELYENAIQYKWLASFIDIINHESAGIISFNWDLILDHVLFNSDTLSRGYGLKGRIVDYKASPLLLKPHGSLNWYDQKQIGHITFSKKINIFKHKSNINNVEAFLYPREIISKNNKYTPLIIPPTYIKDFSRPIFQTLWKKSTDLLSTARNIYILGYSLPRDDLQAQYILRCGLHNQIEGRLKGSGERYAPTGPANIYIVNPCEDIKSRFKEVIGPENNITFINKTVEEWVAQQ